MVRTTKGVSSPLTPAPSLLHLKVMETFFLKFLFIGEQTFLGGGCFTWCLMIRSFCRRTIFANAFSVVGYTLENKSKQVYLMERFILEVNGWEISKVKSSSVSLLLTRTWVLIYFWKVNTTNRILNLKSTFSTLYFWGWGFHEKSVFFFLIFSGDLFLDVLLVGLLWICLFMG